MLNADQVQNFIEGRTVYGFDPVTRAPAAVITYHADGTCTARFADGGRDTGVYGFEGDAYWTRYAQFRGGGTYAFRLEPIGQGVMQAWFTTGARAFVQADHPDPAPWPVPV